MKLLFIKRIIAALIDYSLVFVLVKIISGVPLISFDSIQQNGTEKIIKVIEFGRFVPWEIRLLWQKNLLEIIFFVLIFIVLPFFLNGQTIGKLIFKIKTISLNSNRKLFLSLFIKFFPFIFLDIIAISIIFIPNLNLTYKLISDLLVIFGYVILTLWYFISVIASSGQKSVFDKLARTEVIEKN